MLTTRFGDDLIIFVVDVIAVVVVVSVVIVEDGVSLSKLKSFKNSNLDSKYSIFSSSFEKMSLQLNNSG